MTNTTNLEQVYEQIGHLENELARLDIDAERLEDAYGPDGAASCRTRQGEILAEIDRIAADAGLDLDDENGADR